MSIGILINVHDGIVLAADSASTLNLVPGAILAPQANVPGPFPINVYNNANKIANLYKGEPIGCVAYGSGSVGTISTLLKDFRKLLTMNRGRRLHGTRRRGGLDGGGEYVRQHLAESKHQPADRFTVATY